jgi:Zn-dependent protease/CBS domain-containing protein
MAASGFKIGSVRGIAIKIHISLVLLMAYIVFVVWARFHGVAGEAEIDVGALSLGAVTWGVLIAVGLFASIVLHELGHSLVAQSMGVRVRGITLMMLGGFASMDRIPERRYAEFRLSIVGPLVSFALAGIFALVGTQSSSTDVQFYCHWLANANLVLAIFNMLPAFPLDGGRALRSLLAVRYGHVHATQIAVRIGKGLAWGLGVLGLLTFNMILVMIAFFIYTTAQSELYLLVSRGLLKGMSVGEVTVKTAFVGERDSVAQAVSVMVDATISVLPVLTSSAQPNLVFLHRIRNIPRAYWNTTQVKDVMVEASRALHADDSLSDALTDLASAREGVLPVQERSGRIVGIARYSDMSEILQLRSLNADGEDGPGEASPRQPRRAA